MSSESVLKSVNNEYEVEIKDHITIVKIPETYVDEPPTKEQKETLLKFDKEFACRYTNEDEDYIALVKLESLSPPLVPFYRPYLKTKRYDRSRGERWNKEDNKRRYSDDRDSHYSSNKRAHYD